MINQPKLFIMYTTRNILLFILAGLFAVATNWLLDQEDSADNEATIGRNDPDLYMLNAKITQFATSGGRQHEIIASRLTHFPLTDMTALISPEVKLFARNTTNPWKITADNGRLLPESQLRDEIVELWDNVSAEKSASPGEFIKIKTASLTIYPGQDFAETDQMVTIDGVGGRTSAAGMHAYLNEGRFLFVSDKTHKVITTLLPAAKVR
jgi:lipopolysaccharide export system protein LptC